MNQVPAVVGELVACLRVEVFSEYATRDDMRDQRETVRLFDELQATLSALTAEAGKGEDLHHKVWSLVRAYIQPAAREKVNESLKLTLSTATPAGEWREIESAPKDQQIVMAYFGPEKSLDGFACIGHFFQWDSMPAQLPTGWPWRTLPTHWAPLAASPRGASESGHD